MGLILALETTGDESSIALLKGDVLELDLRFRHGRDLSRLLMSAIQSLFDLSGLSMSNLDALAVSIGPGSFTGLRIGVTAAKTLAFSLSIPTLPVSTLEVLAATARPDLDKRVVAAVDARRGEFFVGEFVSEEGGLRRVSPDILIAAADVWSGLSPISMPAMQGSRDGTEANGCELVVSGSSPIENLIPGNFDRRVALQPQAEWVARLSAVSFKAGLSVDPVDLVPVYIRRSYAEEKSR